MENDVIYILYSRDKHYSRDTQAIVAICTDMNVALSYASQDGATPQQIGELCAEFSSHSGECVDYLIEQAYLNERNAI